MALSLWTCAVTLYWMLATPYLLLLPAPVQMQHWPFKQGAEPKRVFPLHFSKKSSILWNHQRSWEPLFVASVDNPCPRIYEPMNNHLLNIYQNFPYYTSKEITFPRTSSVLASHQHWQKWFHRSHEMKVADDINSANVCWNINTSYLVCICWSY